MKVSAALQAYRDEKLSLQRRGHSTHRSLSLLFAPAEHDDLAAVSPERFDALIRAMSLTAPVHAERAHAYAMPFFQWAVDRRLISVHPARSLKRPQQAIRRDRVLSLAEIRIVWTAAQELGHPFASAAQFLMLTLAPRGGRGA